LEIGRLQARWTKTQDAKAQDLWHVRYHMGSAEEAAALWEAPIQNDPGAYAPYRNWRQPVLAA
jgi:hypothetical protein